MKKTTYLLILLCSLLCTACVHSATKAALGKLVGSDRDEHGCIPSAGYTWSYALHDCVRLWEVGMRFDSGPQQIFLVYSADSTFAEIFPAEGKSIICKRVKSTNSWKNKKGKESVYINNGIVCVKMNDFTYTQKK